MAHQQQPLSSLQQALQEAAATLAVSSPPPLLHRRQASGLFESNFGGLDLSVNATASSSLVGETSTRTEDGHSSLFQQQSEAVATLPPHPDQDDMAANTGSTTGLSASAALLKLKALEAQQREFEQVEEAKLQAVLDKRRSTLDSMKSSSASLTNPLLSTSSALRHHMLLQPPPFLPTLNPAANMVMMGAALLTMHQTDVALQQQHNKKRCHRHETNKVQSHHQQPPKHKSVTQGRSRNTGTTSSRPSHHNSVVVSTKPTVTKSNQRTKHKRR